MVEQLCAYGILAWMVFIGPALCLWFGIQVGRYGWRRALTNLLVKMFGTPPQEGDKSWQQEA